MFATHRGLLEAAQQVVVLQLEDVLVHVVVQADARLLRRQPRLRRALLGHERRAARRLRDLDPGEPRFLKQKNIRVQSVWSSLEVSMSKLRNFRKYYAEVGQDTQQSCPGSRSGAAAAPGNMEVESGPRISYFKGHLGSNIKVVSLRI